MPQVPLFVSSNQAEGVAQNGSFSVRFQPPLHVPEGAVNTTMHIAHATIPFTEPNVSGTQCQFPDSALEHIANANREKAASRGSNTKLTLRLPWQREPRESACWSGADCV